MLTVFTIGRCILVRHLIDFVITKRNLCHRCWQTYISFWYIIFAAATSAAAAIVFRSNSMINSMCLEWQKRHPSDDLAQLWKIRKMEKSANSMFIRWKSTHQVFRSAHESNTIEYNRIRNWTKLKLLRSVFLSLRTCVTRQIKRYVPILNTDQQYQHMLSRILCSNL